MTGLELLFGIQVEEKVFEDEIYHALSVRMSGEVMLRKAAHDCLLPALQSLPNQMSETKLKRETKVTKKEASVDSVELECG
jgi:hypothetical protein